MFPANLTKSRTSDGACSVRQPSKHFRASFNRRFLRVLLAFLLAYLGATAVNSEELALAKISDDEFRQISELMRELRNIKKDALFVPVARLQLLYLDNQIEQAKESNPETANKIRKFARGVAYNIAAFTWPGWGDTGPISQEAQELGFSAARVGLEYSKAAEDVTSNILWINGAHALAAREFNLAVQHFEDAFEISETDIDKLMQTGWITLCRLLDSPSDQSKATFDTAFNNLQSNDHEYAEFFAEQLTTARKIFTDKKTDD